MVGVSDQVGQLLMGYYEVHGLQAPQFIRDDASRALGRHDWDEVQRLERAKLRFERMQRIGLFDVR